MKETNQSKGNFICIFGISLYNFLLDILWSFLKGYNKHKDWENFATSLSPHCLMHNISKVTFLIQVSLSMLLAQLAKIMVWDGLAVAFDVHRLSIILIISDTIHLLDRFGDILCTLHISDKLFKRWLLPKFSSNCNQTLCKVL